MLYTLSSSPYFCDFESVLEIISADDDLLLISDGVIAGIKGSYFLNILLKCSFNIYGLKNDIYARGIVDIFSAKIPIIQYIDFVKLTEKQRLHVSW